MPCGIRRVALFGSAARGEDRPESDVDILVKLKPPNERAPLGLFKWMDLVTEDGITPYIRPYVDETKVILYEE